MADVAVQPDWLDPGVVDLAAVARWGAQAGLGGGPIDEVRRIGGGTQNVVLRLRWGGRDVVLRRPPEHLRPSSNPALRREMRVLAALAGTGVPHPALLAGCEDESVLGGAVFYVMEAVDGDNPGESVSELYRTDPAARRAGALDVVTCLARLSSLDHEALGLGDVGRPVGFLARQVPRWLDHLASYDQVPGYPRGQLPHVPALAAWLEAHRPPDGPPGILHGDYHLNNVLLDRAAPRVTAVVDWEMCTVGDPLLDLGWLLVTWPDPKDDEPVTGAPLAALGDLPEQDELRAEFARHSTRDLSALDWYIALAGLKFAIVIEGTHARAHAGQADPETGAMLHRAAIAALERAAATAGL